MGKSQLFATATCHLLAAFATSIEEHTMGRKWSFELAPDVPGQALQFDEISPKFIAVSGLFRLEDRAIANAGGAVPKFAKRKISA